MRYAVKYVIFQREHNIYKWEIHRLRYSAFRAAGIFLYFLFLTKNRQSNRLNQKLWMGRKQIRAYSRKLVHVCVKVRGTWREQRWRESAGNRAVSMPFPWKLSTSRGPTELSGRFSTSRSTARYGTRKKGERERIIRLQ